MKSAVTSKRVSKIAGASLQRISRSPHQQLYLGTLDIVAGSFTIDINPAISKEGLLALAGSDLGQVAGKKTARKASKK